MKKHREFGASGHRFDSVGTPVDKKLCTSLETAVDKWLGLCKGELENMQIIFELVNSSSKANLKEKRITK